MSIKDYLKKYDLSARELGRRLHFTGQAVCMWISGERRPSKRNAKFIVKYTDEEITMEDLGW